MMAARDEARAEISATVNKIELACATPGCGRRFSRWPSAFARRERVYCSRACYRASGVGLRDTYRGGSPASAARPRVVARQAALELACPHRTPRPGEGRAPTTTS